MTEMKKAADAYLFGHIDTLTKLIAQLAALQPKEETARIIDAVEKAVTPAHLANSEDPSAAKHIAGSLSALTDFSRALAQARQK